MKKSISARWLVLTTVSLIVCAAVVYMLAQSRAEKARSAQLASRGINLIPKPIAKSDPYCRASRPSDQNEKPTLASSDRAGIAEAEAALEDPNIVAKRMQAVLSLREQPSPESIALLSQYLEDPEPAVVAEAVDTLGFIAMSTNNEVLKARVLDILLEKAKDKSFNARGSALITAAMLGEDNRTFSIIAEYIAEEGDAGKAFAVRALAFLASPACVPQLAEILKNTKDLETSKSAASLLARIGTAEALDLLSKDLYSRRDNVQFNSAWALSRKSQDDTNALLIAAVSSNRLPESALGIIASSPAAPAVFGGTLDLNIPTEDKIYLLDVLSAYTSNAPGSVRNQVAKTIEPLLNSTDSDLQLAAIKAMGKVGAITDQSGALAEKFDSDSFLVRGAALESFIQYCSPKNYKPMIKLWYDKNEKIRRTAFFFSEAFVNISDLEDLQKATTHSDEFIAKHSKLMIKYLTQPGVAR